MKKIISILVAVVLLFAAVVSASAATPSLSVKASSTAMNSAETVYFKVSFSESVTVKSLGLTVEFDKNVFTIVSGSWKVEKTVMSDAFGSIVPNNAVMLLKNDTALSGEIFEFALRVNDSAEKLNTKIIVKPVAKNDSGDVAVSSASVDIRINPDLGPGGSSSVVGSTESDSSDGSSIIGGSVSQNGSGTESGSNASETTSGTDSDITSSHSSEVGSDNVNNGQDDSESNIWMIVFIVICIVLAVAVVVLVIILVRNKKY